MAKITLTNGNTINLTDSNNNITLYQSGSITGASTVAWGAITGTLSNQTDLQSSLDGKLANVVEDTTPQLGGKLDAQNNKIINLAIPTESTDAVNKAYVDTPSLATDTAGNTVTINSRRGYFTTATLFTGAGGGTPTLTLNNSTIANGDIVRWSFDSYSNTIGTWGVPHIVALTATAGQATAVIRNIHPNNALNGTIRVFFEVITV